MAESSPLFGFDPSATKVVGNYGQVAEAQGDIADAAAKSKSQKAPFDFLGVGKVATDIAANLAAEKNAVDAHTAKLRATEFMKNNEHLTGHELATAIEGEIQGISEGDNFSSGYKKGALAVFDVGYAQALERKEEERVASTLNVVQSNFSTQLADNKANGIAMTEGYAQEWANNTAATMRLPVEYVRNAMVGAYYQDAQDRITVARNKNELAEAQAYIAEAGKVLRTPLFLDSRSKKFLPVLNSLKSNLDATITAKKKEFKDAAAVFVETTLKGGMTDVWDTYPEDPATYASVVRESVSSDAEYVRKMRELTNGYQEAQEARSYILNYDIYGFKTEVPSSSENKYISSNIDKMVAHEMVKNLGTPDLFIQVVNRNPDSMKVGGDQLLHAFRVTENPEELAQMKEAFDNILAFPNGAQALQMAFGNSYKDVVGISVLADVYTNGDVQKAKAVFAEAKGALIQTPINPDLKDELYTNIGDLDTMGDEYNYAVNTLLAVSPGLVDKDMLDSLYDKFAAGLKDVDGVRFNVSRFDSSAAAYDPDTFMEQVISSTAKLNGGVTPRSVRNLRNNVMTFTDEFGFTAGTINANPVLNIGNQLYEAMASSDEQQVDHWTRMGDTLDVMTTWVSEAATTSILNTEGQLAADNKMYEGLAEVWNASSSDKGKIAGDILALKAMFPETIDPEAVPDYNERKNLEARNLEMQGLVEEMATRMLGRDVNTVMEEESMTQSELRRKWRHGN
jgi:hypothetical protein